MSKKMLHIAMAALITVALRPQAAAIDVSWDGGGDGYSWSDANNWDPNIVPNEDSNVTIDNSGYVGIEIKQDRTIKRLDCYGRVKFSRWNAYWFQITFGVDNDTNDFTNHGNFSAWPNYGINGNVTNCMGATIDLKNLAINNGNLRNLEGAEISVGGEVDVAGYSIGGSLVNSGVINIEPPAGECGSDRIFDNNSTGLIQGSGAVSSNQMFRNQGKIIAKGGSLVVESDGPLINTGVIGNKPSSSLHIKPAEDVNNQGTIEVNADGGVAFDCNLINMADANIYLHGGTLAATNITQKADATFEGQGDISGNLTIDPNGLIRLTGPANIFGNVQIDPNATLEISDGTTLIKGHCTCDNGIIHMKGGWLIPQGGLTNNNCNIIWEPGLYNNIADFNLDGTVNLMDFADFAETWLWKSDLYSP